MSDEETREREAKEEAAEEKLAHREQRLLAAVNSASQEPPPDPPIKKELFYDNKLQFKKRLVEQHILPTLIGSGFVLSATPAQISDMAWSIADAVAGEYKRRFDESKKAWEENQ